MKICVAGQGAFGQKHLDALKRIPGVEVTSLVGGNQDATAAIAKKYGIPHYTGELSRRHQARRRGDPDHADQDAFPPGRAGDARRQARAGRNPGHRLGRGRRGSGQDRKRDRRHRDGRPCAALQSEPSIRAQEDRGRRTEDPADGRADLFLPPQEHQRGGQRAELDRSSAVAPRRPHRRPVRRTSAARTFPSATRCRGRSTRSSASRWTWASSARCRRARS